MLSTAAEPCSSRLDVRGVRGTPPLAFGAVAIQLVCQAISVASAVPVSGQGQQTPSDGSSPVPELTLLPAPTRERSSPAALPCPLSLASSSSGHACAVPACQGRGSIQKASPETLVLGGPGDAVPAAAAPRDGSSHGSGAGGRGVQ